MIRKILLLCLLAGASVACSHAAESQYTLNNEMLVLDRIPEIPPTVVDRLNQYQNTRGAGFRGWSADGQSIYISTRFSDLRQLHRVNMPGGARHQLTFFKEPFSSALRHPSEDRFILSIDEGGGEFYQLFEWLPSDGSLRLLTDGESRNGSANFNRDGSLLAYSSTHRNGASRDLWIMDPKKPDEARMIFPVDDGTAWFIADWMEDDRHLLLGQYISSTESRIHLLDIETGETTPLEGMDSEGINLPFGFDATGDGFFFTTNRYGDFHQLAYHKLEDSNVTPITDQLPWDLEDGAFSQDRTRAAFTLNEDGMNTLYLLDPENFEYRKVEGLPVGLIGGLEFSPDGTRLGLVLNNPQSSSDCFVLELGEKPLEYGTLTRWTYSETGGLDPTAFAPAELIRYRSFDDLEVPAFIYKPEGEGPFPVIISIHGGPEGQSQPHFSSSRQLLIDQLNAVVIEPNVRGSSGYGSSYLQLDNGYLRENSVKDIGSLLDWIESQPDLDSSRVAVMGGSYGGYMVLACSVHYSDRLSAAIDVVGISNFVTFLENTQSYRRDLRRVEYGDERDPDMRAFLESISPLNHIGRIQIPMLIVQGQNDPRVPVTEAEQMVEALRKTDKECWYLLGKNEGHGFRRKENYDIYNQVKFLFLETFL